MAELRPTTTVGVDNTLTGTNSNINTISLLQPTSFKLVVNREQYSNLEFFCQSVAHPSLDVPEAPLPYKGIGNLPMPGDKLIFGTLEVIILVDENMNAYTELYNWIQRITQSANVPAFKAKPDGIPPTVCDMTLLMLTSHNNVSRQIKYRDCVPTALGNMTMEATTGDTVPITVPATFRFSYFDFE